ncbi:hypothetical protein OROMI_033766 [Orobanche minor]
MGSSINPNPSPVEEVQPSLLKKLLCYPLYVIFPILLNPLIWIHFHCLRPQSIKSGNSSNRIATPHPTPAPQEVVSREGEGRACEYSEGEWVPIKAAPLYNGTTCDTIKKGQNCMAYGRPDRDYLFWKWRPSQCELPRFDPAAFLKLVQNKHIAFVGDSLARNQLESLRRQAAPRLHKRRRQQVPPTFSIYWSPFLVKGIEKLVERNFNTLFLDLPRSGRRI